MSRMSFSADEFAPAIRKQIAKKIAEQNPGKPRDVKKLGLEDTDEDGKKRNKFSAESVMIDGYHFDSRAEGERYKVLALLLKAGDIRDLKLHTAYKLVVNNVQIAVYKDDFNYIDRLGIRRVEDVKGYKGGTSYRLFKLKAALMKAIHGIEVIEV